MLKNINVKIFAILLSFSMLAYGTDESKEKDKNKDIVKIMPMGDSITYDNRRSDTRPVGKRTGYRSHLWYMLKDAKYSANFVGSLAAGQDITPPFDPDNEGHSGWTSFELAEKTYDYMIKSQPDIVLLHIGTNDRGTTSPSGVDDILNDIDLYEEEAHKKVLVYVALIIDRKEHDGGITIFNRRLEKLLTQRSIRGDRIVIVDMNHDAKLTSSDYADNTHPNDKGYKKMAKVWFDALIAPYTPELYRYPSKLLSAEYVYSMEVDEYKQQVAFVTAVPNKGITF